MNDVGEALIDCGIEGIQGDPWVYLNGAWGPLSAAKVSVLDRGFIFGDGVYEVVPLYQRRPFRWAQHRARLTRSLAALRIPDPYSDAQWADLLTRLSETSPAADQFIYLQVTRGVARRDHAMPAGLTPTVFAMTQPLVRPSASQREAGVHAVSMLDERWLHCEIKSISLLGNVLARQYAVDHGVFEVLQFRDDRLTEGASSNVWVVSQGQIFAPPPSPHILEGIRYGLMDELCAELGLPLTLQAISREQVRGADELLLTSATKEILAVVRLDGQPVGAGQPGPIYARLRAAYDRAIQEAAGAAGA